MADTFSCACVRSMVSPVGMPFHLRCQIFPWCYGSFVFLCGSLGHFVFLYISVLMHLYYDRAEFCSAIVAPSMVFAMMAAAITITTAFPFSGLIPSDRNHNMFRPSYNTPVRSLFPEAIFLIDMNSAYIIASDFQIDQFYRMFFSIHNAFL